MVEINMVIPTITLTILLSLVISTLKRTTPHKMKNNLMLLFSISLIPTSLLLNSNYELTLSSTPLITTPTENITTSILLNSLSLSFLPIALFITWAIMEFSIWYMQSDPNINKFMKYLLIFLIMMITITTANNMYQLFVGWEGVGIMSFMLIGWWSGRSNANTAALQAIIYNRIGDIGLIMTTAWLMTSSSINLQELLQIESTHILPMIGLLAAATGKSAQFGLHPWLPSAMEGPTPVSALLHSSTMVVAGVFLLIQLHPILNNNKTLTTLCLILGATTTMFASASATTHTDIKKIIALSTTSQLGLMMTMIGLNQPNLAFLHMITHSFFKALLFLCSGSLIHSLNNEQDVRKMGALMKTHPSTASFIIIANLSLIGMPFMSGFYSKDTIIEEMMNSYTNSWTLTMTLVAISLSASYSTKMIMLTLTGYPHTNHNKHKETKTVILPLSRLTTMSILMGTLTKTSTFQMTTTTTMPKTMKLLALTATLTGIIMTKDLISTTTHLDPKTPNTPHLFLNQLAFFNIPHRTVTMNMLKTSQKTSTELIDLWALESWGPKGLTNTLTPPIHLSTQQKNMIKNYMTAFTVTLLICVTTH